MESEGILIHSRLAGCECDSLYLTNVSQSEALLKSAVVESGLNIMGANFISFSTPTQDAGYTGNITLAESHIAIHTWAEINKVNLQIYVCNYSCDNTEKAQKLFELCCDIFKPTDIKKKEFIGF